MKLLIFLVFLSSSVDLLLTSAAYDTMERYLKIYKTCWNTDDIFLCLIKKSIVLIDILESKGNLSFNENVKIVKAASSSVIKNEEEIRSENVENVVNDNKYLVAYEMLVRRIWKYFESYMIEIYLPHVSKDDILEIGKYF